MLSKEEEINGSIAGTCMNVAAQFQERNAARKRMDLQKYLKLFLQRHSSETVPGLVAVSTSD
jgi:hypothetical protein